MPDSQPKVDRPRDGMVLPTLDDPGRRNAMTGPMTGPMTEPMTDAWRRTTAEIAVDPDLRVVEPEGLLEAAIQWEAPAQLVTPATADRREGLEAARGRRAPGFTWR
jgi:hypothetical protein